MQLGEFTYMTSKQVITIQVVKDRNNRNGDTRMIPVVPSLLREVRLRWRGVAPHKANQCHKDLTLFSGELCHKGLFTLH